MGPDLLINDEACLLTRCRLRREHVGKELLGTWTPGVAGTFNATAQQVSETRRSVRLTV